MRSGISTDPSQCSKCANPRKTKHHLHFGQLHKYLELTINSERQVNEDLGLSIALREMHETFTEKEKNEALVGDDQNYDVTK